MRINVSLDRAVLLQIFRLHATHAAIMLALYIVTNQQQHEKISHY
jgi:hypothetical protein